MTTTTHDDELVAAGWSVHLNGHGRSGRENYRLSVRRILVAAAVTRNPAKSAVCGKSSIW